MCRGDPGDGVAIVELGILSEIQNKGWRDGKKTIQLYIHMDYPAAAMPCG
jgi:hypothetical protein